MTRIRLATPLDWEAVHAVHLAAFPERERQSIAELAVALLRLESSPPTLSIVAEEDDEVVGHVAFSPVGIADDGHRCGYLLAPLAVTPGHQGQRVGTRLVDHGIRQLADSDADILFVYGDPGYYRRFGFDAARAAAYRPPHELEYPFGWQALRLDPSARPAAGGNLRCVAPLDDPALW